MANTNNAAQKVVRCAIYTRKSTEERLEQSYNSLMPSETRGKAGRYYRHCMTTGGSPGPIRSGPP